jgi:hypothetical protein
MEGVENRGEEKEEVFGNINTQKRHARTGRKRVVY